MKKFLLLLLCSLFWTSGYSQGQVSTAQVSSFSKGKMKIAKGQVGGDYQQNTFVILSQGSGDRATDFTVNLEANGFSKTPFVQYGVTRLDTWNASNQRVRVDLVEATKSFLKFRVTTWAESRVFAITIDWIALGE